MPATSHYSSLYAHTHQVDLTSGHNRITVIPGANDTITTAEIDAAAHIIQGCRILVVQLELPLAITMHAMRVARAAEGGALGPVVLLNPAPAKELPDEIYALADFVMPNETELASLAGMPVDSGSPSFVEDVKAAAQVLVDKGSKAVVVTLGERGCLLLDNQGTFFHADMDDFKRRVGMDVDVVDTTGAGDCFVGSFAYFLAHAVAPQQAMHLANICAARSVCSKGTQTSYPSRADFDPRFFDMGIQAAEGAKLTSAGGVIA
jgi:ribokinase